MKWLVTMTRMFVLFVYFCCMVALTVTLLFQHGMKNVIQLFVPKYSVEQPATAVFQPVKQGESVSDELVTSAQMHEWFTSLSDAEMKKLLSLLETKMSPQVMNEISYLIEDGVTAEEAKQIEQQLQMNWPTENGDSLSTFLKKY